jgi:hypothetical protein
VATNLERTAWPGARTSALVLVCASLFGLVHLYEPPLAAATFVLELPTVWLYLRQRNIWPLGVLHGWLGTFFYLWVLDRDLWREAFG